MKIEFRKGGDKNMLTCSRPDGTTTWMEATPFFVAHDLAHFVIEKQLQIVNGFYGLIASGFDITDFEKKREITPQQLPEDSIKAELLVNLILTERNDRKRLESFNATFNEVSERYGLPNMKFDASDLDKIHNQLDEMLKRWASLPINESITLTW